MKLLRSKAEQLADHLGGEIADGKLAPPLPNMRVWSSTLGVARRTLECAIKMLERDGQVRVHPRKGVQLLVRAGRRRMDRAGFNRVRWLSYSGNTPVDSWAKEIVHAIDKELQRHGIRFCLEQCDARRLRTIHAAGESPHEMFLLVSLPPRFQRLFSDFKKSALVDGSPVSGVRLPGLSIDVVSAIRHATLRLGQSGFRKIYLVMKEGSQAPMKEIFGRICAAVPCPVEGEVTKLPNDLHEQSRAARRLTMRMHAGQAMIAVYPIPASLLIAAALQRGLKVPGEVEVVAMNTSLQGVQTVPVPTYYPYPLERYAAALARIARNYFEKGKLPLVQKLIPLEAVPSRD